MWKQLVAKLIYGAVQDIIKRPTKDPTVTTTFKSTADSIADLEEELVKIKRFVSFPKDYTL